jgi:hypothetical protein
MTTTPFANVPDVEDAWRPLTDDEIGPTDYLLRKASRMIRNRFPTIDARITAGELDADLVGDVAIAMVKRSLRNPDGKRQESIEDYSFTRDQVTASGEVTMTDEEERLLAPPSSRSTAFSVNTSRCPTYVPRYGEPLPRRFR